MDLASNNSEIQAILHRAREGSKLLERDQEMMDLRIELHHWIARALFLEAAVRNYADHVWNDIERILKDMAHD